VDTALILLPAEHKQVSTKKIIVSDPIDIGEITQTSVAGGGITNTTGPGFHAACCGTVTRTPVIVNDRLYVLTIGVGTNYPGSRGFNEFAGPRTFRALDLELARAAAAKKR
jgi:hypothetical protein